MPTDSLISRTNQRIGNAAAAKALGTKSYSQLEQSYNVDVSSDSEYEDENIPANGIKGSAVLHNAHPNPLRSHPTSDSQINHLEGASLHPAWDNSGRKEFSTLSEMNANTRRVSNSRDITDQLSGVQSPWKKQRDSSIQLDDSFYSKPYGQLKCATPPLHVGVGRKVSSGVDFMSTYSGEIHERRNVSGKVAEEGRVANRALR